jgi:hypothetical protein
MKVTGGKAIYGAAVGILMLDARFPRIPGDIGNATTWPFPVLYKVVRDATPDQVVRRNADGFLDAFNSAACELVGDGADGITTNCGFLSIFQNEIAGAVKVPVVTSSLMQVAMVNSLLPPGKQAGVLTVCASTLTNEHLEKANVPLGTPIGTTEGRREFSRAILDNELELDVDAARADNVDAALDLVASNANIGAIVLECTNMVPYAADIREATGVPVFSMRDLICWFHQGLSPSRF